MGIQQNLHTKLVQKLILTPSLQQAIKLLPMSTLELSDLLNQEMVENPMLEEVPTARISSSVDCKLRFSCHIRWSASELFDDSVFSIGGSSLTSCGVCGR